MKARPALLLPLLLAGCMNETASLQFAGPDHALTLQVRQSWFWSPEVELEAVMSRQPDCQRRSRLDGAPAGDFKVDVLRPDEGEFAEPILILRQGANAYAVSTANCEMQKFASLPAKPGTRLGTFQREGGKLKFVAAPPAPPTPPAAQPQ